MNLNYKIIVVEDDRTTRLLLDSTLGKTYTVEIFDTAEALLSSPSKGTAQLYLLDVGLPGMDGLTLCRTLKAETDTGSIPVMFLSGHDSPEEVLAGYEAGAQDYILKPFDVTTLHYKIENLRRIEADREGLAEQLQDSDALTTQVLANLDEYAVLVKFLRNLNECKTPQELIEASQHTLQAFNLEGAIQIRLGGVEKTSSSYGENWPLEVAVIRHMRTQGSIFEHKHLAAFNFEHITILVTNMPREDFELCGRIRDHLAIAVESAHAKLTAMQFFTENTWMRGSIQQLLQSITDTVDNLSKKYQHARYLEGEYTARFLDEISAAFVEIGMSERQEDMLLDNIRKKVKLFIDLYDIAPETEQTLKSLIAQMQQILASES